ncbi:Unknown protein sequence [Pseudomonas syringae pv. castaneae]|uniref:Uncharacterized protein n=2 Tax=Pseudomonas syringae group TaxID=136849 RepID=A0A0P9N683_PSESX|nr:Unknown protein sequence [Pseudomonas syringae pv. castaneae]
MPYVGFQFHCSLPPVLEVESYLEWSHAEQAYILHAPAVGLPPPGGSLHSI